MFAVLIELLVIVLPTLRRGLKFLSFETFSIIEIIVELDGTVL